MWPLYFCSMTHDDFDFLGRISVLDVMTDEAVRSRLVSLYSSTFFEEITCSGCSGEITGAIKRLRKYYRNNPTLPMAKTVTTPAASKGATTGASKATEESKEVSFTLKNPNVRVYSPTLKTVFTKANMTDKAALAILSESGNNEKLFSKLPDGYKKNATKPEKEQGGEVTVKTTEGVELKVVKAGAEMSNGDAVTLSDGDPLADGEYTLEGDVKIKVAEGKIVA